MNQEFCDISDKGKSCCSKPIENSVPMDLKAHWNQAYRNSPDEQLGWYETDLSPTLGLVSKSNLGFGSRILNVGSGSTNLIDALLQRGYSKLIATDLSEVALQRLKARVGEKMVEFIVDDLTRPESLLHIEPVDLWIDRAVLHFFTDPNEQSVYFDLLKNKVKPGGFVMLAQFNLEGADKCSGLPVVRYSREMFEERLGEDFELLDSFNYTYTMPNGEERPYVYALFRKG
ncbi:class I SAM-dependent methyltransferase [Algoriphagus sp. CAU 1675]|uniref:class I SAM-dependent methyltransferase n=1 Tax=Algoriphagus sp. CAU 1675 TaxID=3032597 RepID=UPI0023DA2E03|nr:class I SAM-dependent methyltransferase [Algoriphagus sp. CAU 1675]MDF2157252.1 class I SAM-dependent methyltransferase [Algoriphagus sp. CAU 1675]